MGMGILNAIGKSAMVALSGGSLSEVNEALLSGFAEGCAMGMLICAVAAITVTSLSAVFASVMAADAVLNVVLSIYNVMDGNYRDALIFASLATVDIIGVCKWYRLSYRGDVIGDKGVATFAGEGGSKTDLASNYGIDMDNLNFSNTVQNHTGRPYQDSKLLINEIIESIAPIPDTRGTNALSWNVEESYNGSDGYYELIIDPS